MEPLCLFVDVPMASFRPMWSREYQDTYPVPPPSTIYGMLLSLIGVEYEEKERHSGVKIAMALQDQPEIGRVFRKFRRVARSNPNADPLTDRRPDYQELVLWLKFWLWIDDSEAGIPLNGKIRAALDKERRRTIVSYGALCLGESSHMVNEIKIAVGDVAPTANEGRFLVRDKTGFLTMPVWTDHESDIPHVETLALLARTPLPSHPSEEEKWITVGPRTNPLV